MLADLKIIFYFIAIMLFHDELPPWIYLCDSYESSRGTLGRTHLPNVFLSVFAQLLSNPSSVFSFIQADTSCSFHLAEVTYIMTHTRSAIVAFMYLKEMLCFICFDCTLITCFICRKRVISCFQGGLQGLFSLRFPLVFSFGGAKRQKTGLFFHFQNKWNSMLIWILNDTYGQILVLELCLQEWCGWTMEMFLPVKPYERP